MSLKENVCFNFTQNYVLAERQYSSLKEASGFLTGSISTQFKDEQANGKVFLGRKSDTTENSCMSCPKHHFKTYLYKRTKAQSYHSYDTFR